MLRANIRNKLIKALVENFKKEYNEFNLIFQKDLANVRKNPVTVAPSVNSYKFFLTHFYKNKPLMVIKNNIF